MLRPGIAYLNHVSSRGLTLSALNANGNQLHPVSGPGHPIGRDTISATGELAAKGTPKWTGKPLKREGFWKVMTVQQRPLTLSITRKGPEPLYYSLARAVQDAVENGQLHVGEKLPSEEELRLDLKLARNTVRQAWCYLEQAGVISRRQGAGTFIVGLPEAAAPPEYPDEARE